MRVLVRSVVVVAAGAALCTCATVAAPDGAGGVPSLTQRRAALIECAGGGPEAIARLTEALDDENLVLRRTAVRVLGGLGPEAKAALERALANDDVVVRRAALWAICGQPGVDAAPYLATAIEDDEELVRQVAVAQLVRLTPRTDQVIALLRIAEQDTADSVRKMASAALWPFHGQRIPLRERKDYDHDITVVDTIPLPKEGWRFRLDPDRNGHLKDWFAPGFDDGEWDLIDIEQAWQKAGHDYVGVAWYRRWIELPEKPAHTAVELHFKGVDECAWVWVNGVYVGEHDVGPGGWDVPFLLNVTEELKWGEKNQITVRAMNTQFAGGIWRPVAIEVLQ
ncbi:MAG: HEAT repeat domain-containing protein [Candidatus Hydrogenedentes bacterium]|nr:HEAT repeat domain-containing protein [Candidatus Hydrogenedentota bacterium]